MDLVNDAISAPSQSFSNKIFSRDRISKALLNEIIEDLDEREIISIIFLMTDCDTNISEVIEHLRKDYFETFKSLSLRNNWEDKLLESLIVIKCFNILRRIGFSKNEINDMKVQYSSEQHNVSLYLNRVIKSLYFLCEELGQKDSQTLINEVNKQLHSPVTLEDNKYLEIYILHWLYKNYITIDTKHNLDDLITNLKKIGCLSNFPVDFNFDFWKSQVAKHQKDSLNNDNSLEYKSNISKNMQHSEDLKNIWSVKKKLCIIVNEINFEPGKFKVRSRKEGSIQDEQNLEETFKGCGFDIEKFRDLTTSEMVVLLDSFNESKYANYGCIFICILSHGYIDAVIFSDGDDLEIGVIIDKFCCSNLRKVFKCIILQSCQGERMGVLESTTDVNEQRLVTDGPTGNALNKLHFLLFKATIPNFVAIRDKSFGSWFIQDVCNVIQNDSPINITDWHKKVSGLVSSRRGESNDNNKKIVQVPEVESTIIIEFTIPAFLKV